MPLTVVGFRFRFSLGFSPHCKVNSPQCPVLSRSLEVGIWWNQFAPLRSRTPLPVEPRGSHEKRDTSHLRDMFIQSAFVWVGTGIGIRICGLAFWRNRNPFVLATIASSLLAARYLCRFEMGVPFSILRLFRVSLCFPWDFCVVFTFGLFLYSFESCQGVEARGPEVAWNWSKEWCQLTDWLTGSYFPDQWRCTVKI